MQINVITNDRNTLRQRIFQAVENEVLETWEIVKSKDQEWLLTPKATQYNNIVLLRFEISSANEDLVVFPTHWNGRETPSLALYAIVIGMITATLLTHFSPDFSQLQTKI